jgi:hypothetical protein
MDRNPLAAAIDGQKGAHSWGHRAPAARAFARLLDEEVKKMPRTLKNRTTRADRIRKVKAGLQKYYASTPLVLAGTSYQPAGLQAFLQADVDANDAATKAKASLRQTAKDAKSTDQATDPVLTAIHSQVEAQYGAAPNADTVRADFGYARKTRQPLTAEQKAAAAAKRKATREARHTMGPKEKSKIHGTVVSSSPTSTGSSGASPSGSTNKSNP